MIYLKQISTDSPKFIVLNNNNFPNKSLPLPPGYIGRNKWLSQFCSISHTYTEMQNRRLAYIRTDTETHNLVEMLLLEITGLRNEITDLKASVIQLKPLNSIQLFTEEETAAILNVSKNTLITLRHKHNIQFHKINARILYSVEDIREFEGRCRE